MTVQNYDFGRFLVSSRSRIDMAHLVDLMWAEEMWHRPRAKCSCESSFIHGRICPHIEAVVNHLKPTT